MKSLRILACLLALVTLQAVARDTVPVVNFENVAVATVAGKSLAPAQVKQAIQSAATQRQWTLAEQSPGVLYATLVVRNKHTVIAEIKYSGESYSVVYRDSIDMNAAVKNGQTFIHPFYNRWVRDLNDSIRAALPKA